MALWHDVLGYAAPAMAAARTGVLLVPLHIGGVWLRPLAHTENLLLAMITGRKRAPGPGDIG